MTPEHAIIFRRRWPHKVVMLGAIEAGEFAPRFQIAIRRTILPALRAKFAESPCEVWRSLLDEYTEVLAAAKSNEVARRQNAANIQ